MRRFIFILLMIGWALAANAIDISVTPLAFKSPGQNYLEVHLFVLGSSVTFESVDSSQSQAGVEVLILIKQDSTVVQFDKYRLDSPLTDQPINFVDLKRFALPNGSYQLEVNVQDVNQQDNHKKYDSTIHIGFDDEQLFLSDIQLLGSFTKDESNNPLAKSGYLMESLPFNFCSKETDRLMFYLEVYNSNKTIKDEYLIKYLIQQVSGNGATRPVLMGHKKNMPRPINSMLIQKDISKLTSGNYELLVEVRNRENTVLQQKRVAFQRSNPKASPIRDKNISTQNEFVGQMNVDELKYSLKAIAPIIEDGSVEVLNMVIAGGDTLAQRRMLFSFWFKRNQQNPKLLYEKYMEVAQAVDKKYYSGFGFGFESDRGYTFMRYGKPDDIVTVLDEPSAPPYEIWIYNNFPKTNQRNVKFLFYNPSLASGNYRLLHSTARGELNNPQWEITLYADDPNTVSNSNIDTERAPDGIGRRARAFFNDF